jgi:hypothetical protein
MLTPDVSAESTTRSPQVEGSPGAQSPSLEPTAKDPSDEPGGPTADDTTSESVRLDGAGTPVCASLTPLPSGFAVGITPGDRPHDDAPVESSHGHRTAAAGPAGLPLQLKEAARRLREAHPAEFGAGRASGSDDESTKVKVTNGLLLATSAALAALDCASIEHAASCSRNATAFGYLLAELFGCPQLTVEEAGDVGKSAQRGEWKRRRAC